jgi:hypothetical protein
VVEHSSTDIEIEGSNLAIRHLSLEKNCGQKMDETVLKIILSSSQECMICLFGYFIQAEGVEYLCQWQ